MIELEKILDDGLTFHVTHINGIIETLKTDID